MSDPKISHAVKTLIAQIYDLPVELRAAFTIQYFIDPTPPEIILDHQPKVIEYLDKYHDRVLAEKQYLKQYTKLLEQAGWLAGAPDKDSAALYWMIRLRSESPFFHRMESGGGWIIGSFMATEELLQHLLKTDSIDISRVLSASSVAPAAPGLVQPAPPVPEDVPGPKPAGGTESGSQPRKTPAEWLKEWMNELGLASGYAIQKRSGPSQHTINDKILKDVPVGARTWRKLIKTLLRESKAPNPFK
jgi:hypothetical protein